MADRPQTFPARLEKWFLHGWILAGVLGFLIYLPSLTYDFTYDDALIIKENPRIQDLANWREYLATSYWDTPGQNKEYRPLSMLSYAVNYAVAEKNPISYHAINILLHALVCVAAWFLIWMLFSRAASPFVGPSL